MSPCIGICQLDGSETCFGCFRTIEEVAAWPLLSDPDRLAVLDLAKARAQAAEGCARLVFDLNSSKTPDGLH